MGEEVNLLMLTRELEERDRRDAEREIAPLKAAADAILLDTTQLSIDGAFERACQIIDEVRSRKR
jgi:cytidylate kinase